MSVWFHLAYVSANINEKVLNQSSLNQYDIRW